MSNFLETEEPEVELQRIEGEVVEPEPDLSPPPPPEGAVRATRVLSVTLDPAPNGLIVRARGVRPDFEHTTPRLRLARTGRLTPPGGVLWYHMLLSDPDEGKISLRLPTSRFINIGTARPPAEGIVAEDTSIPEESRIVEAATFVSRSQLRGATTVTVLGQDSSASIQLP